jgi:hypothetical protein
MVGELKEASMTRCRITRTLGAAVGGLVGAAYLPAAFAFADDIVITPDPSSTELVTGFYGLHNVTAPPAVPGTVQGEQLFDYVDKTTGESGTFYGYESVDQLSRNDYLYFVTPDQQGATNPLNPGSVIDIKTEGSNDETIYSDLTSSSGGSDVSKETHVTPLGSYSGHETFDPAQYLSDKYVDANVPFADSNVPITAGYTMVPIGGDENITEINGLQPLDIDAQGSQVFALEDPSGNVVGTFAAVQTDTGDRFGNYSEELLVTQDLTGTPGTAPGDVPPVNSVFNDFFHASGEKYNVYADLPSSNGNDEISYTAFNHGKGSDLTTKSDVDAIKALDLNKFEVPSENYTMTPTTPEIQDISGVNGLPPYDNAVQGYEQLDITDSSGNQIGVVDTDVSTALRSGEGHFSEAFLVTDVESGTGGTAPGDVPPVGSVFDVVSQGSGNTYLVYSDIPSSTGDVIKEYRVNAATGAAHAVHTKIDLAAGLSHDQFTDPFASGGIGSADASSLDASALASSVDPSDLASSVDPSGAISADPITDSLLHSGALLDPLPHLEAALQFLTGLF